MSASAYYRTLRDIREGHIGIYVDAQWYDPTTGQRLPEPVVHGGGPDRAPSVGIPDRGGAWWEPMIATGHLALVSDHSRSYYIVTDAGLAWLREHGYQP